MVKKVRKSKQREIFIYELLLKNRNTIFVLHYELGLLGLLIN